jgi:hypothetical protein
MVDATAGSQKRFFLPGQQLFQPPKRGEWTGVVTRRMKVYCRRLPLGQSQGRRFYRLFEPSQVHPRCPQINATEDPATLLQCAPTLFLTDRLHHLIEPHPGERNEKVGKKTLCVLPAESFCRATVANRDFDPHIFLALGITVTAGGITVNDQRMHFSA